MTFTAIGDTLGDNFFNDNIIDYNTTEVTL